MGNSYTTEQYMQRAVTFFEDNVAAGVVPDIGIDPSLLKYSGVDSTSLVQEYNSAIKEQLKNAAPAYTRTLITTLGGFTSVPNAVGLGALVISMLIEIAVAASRIPTESHANMLRRVFAEEKVSELRDLMDEYLKRYRVNLINNDELLKDTRRLEHQISTQLTRVRNSMLKDGHMNSRALKQWVNGAAFHVQMLIQLARLDHGSSTSTQNTIDTYLEDLEKLLQAYRTYKESTLVFEYQVDLLFYCRKARKKRIPVSLWGQPSCRFCDEESGTYRSAEYLKNPSVCDAPANGKYMYLDHMFSQYNQITGTKKYFSDTRNNLNVLIAQCNNRFTV